MGQKEAISMQASLFYPQILEEKNVIDDHLLDLIGNEFKFDHEKGLAEWLKNSADAYIRNNTPDKDQYIFFRFTDGLRDDASLECIDFAGMDEEDIQKAFKVWGNPKAAKRGSKKRTYGGHGNGGKFYMRQMFKKSRFITYKDGFLSIFGFSETRKYGFAKGYKNKEVSFTDALKLAGINQLYSEISDKLAGQNVGFTVVKGICPAGMPNKIRAERIIEKIKNHPQSRNIIKRINLGVVYNDRVVIGQLKPDELTPMVGFENPVVIPIPEKIIMKEEGESREVALCNDNYSAGNLTLSVSNMAFERNGRYEGLNRIDIVGEIGVIASYRLYELGVRKFPQAAFIYGECSCPILEDPDNDAVKNDRTVLVSENPRVKVLLPWIREQIDLLAERIAAREQSEKEKNNIKITSIYNDFLNQWKNKFMRKLLRETITKSEVDLEMGGGEESFEDGDFGKRVLEGVDSIQFSFPEAKISVNEECKITLKTNSPKVIPFGSAVNFVSSNDFIKIGKDEMVITSSVAKESSDGKMTAVINNSVIGTKVGEKGTITAQVGELKAQINIEVIDEQAKSDRKAAYPRVLLSGIDRDPLDIAPGGLVILTEKQPLIHQRVPDIKEGIYWINTAAPLAHAILEKYGSESTKWRDYLLQRYVDIFVKEAIFELQRREPDLFTAENIEGRIFNELMPKIYANINDELNDFLFRENYDLSA